MQGNRQLLFVQGGGQGTHDEWDHKLVQSLERELGPDYEVRYPRMPEEENPQYARWKPALQSELKKLPPGAVLVGHSVGGTILLRLLAEDFSAATFGGVFLLSAPFVGAGGWSSTELEFPNDLAARLPKGAPIHFYQGLADETVPPLHADLYARAVPQARVHRLRGRDHQLSNDLKEVAREIQSLQPERLR